MRLLVTIRGARIEALLVQVAERVGRSTDDEWLALHVTDTRARPVRRRDGGAYA